MLIMKSIVSNTLLKFEYQEYDLQYSTLILSTKKYEPLKSTQIWVTLLNTPLLPCYSDKNK